MDNQLSKIVAIVAVVIFPASSPLYFSVIAAITIITTITITAG